MEFFKKMMGRKDSQAEPSEETGPPIRLVDSCGREILIERKEFLKKVLLPNLESQWNDPAKLYGTILSGLDDGFARAVEPASARLAAMDPAAAGSVRLRLYRAFDELLHAKRLTRTGKPRTADVRYTAKT